MILLYHCLHYRKPAPVRPARAAALSAAGHSPTSRVSGAATAQPAPAKKPTQNHTPISFRVTVVGRNPRKTKFIIRVAITREANGT